MVGGLGLTSRVVYVASCLLVGLALSEAGPPGASGLVYGRGWPLPGEIGCNSVKLEA